MSAVAAWAVRHARAVLAAALVLAVAAGVAATRLPTDGATNTLVDSDTAGYRATQEVRRDFGEEPVVVLAEGDLQRIVLTANLGRLLRLEGCLSGKVPKGAKAIPGPCAELAEQDPVRSLVGPATFLNEATIQVQRELERLVATVPPDKLRELLLQIAAQYGITSAPSLSNPDFLAAIVFDINQSRGTPKAKLAYLFPNKHSAQIILRLRSGLSEAERHRAIETIRAVVHDPVARKQCKFKGKPERCFQLHGARYVISGAPVVVDAVTRALKAALLVLLGVALVVMAVTLLLVFRSRWRLLPLGIALAAAALTFGIFGLVGGSLTMASIAVLPILIGLAVDYAIQLQARYDEAVALGASPGVDAARLAASGGGPAIATACLATAAGFLALQLSPTPMVRGFGLLLVGGVAIAFALAFVGGFAALGLRRAGSPGVPPDAGFFASGFFGRPGRWLGRKTGRGVAPGHPTLPPQMGRVLAVARAYPGRVLAVGLGLAVIGWGLGTQIETQTDIRKLAPQNVEAVEELNELQDATGVSGELDARITAPELTDPATIRWMAVFKRRALKAGGFAGNQPSCQEAEVCPGPALSDFVSGGGLTATGEGPLTQKSIRAALKQIPAYDLRQVATVDPKTGLPAGTALVGFGIRAQSLDSQQELIERIRGAVGEPGTKGGPPPGVEVELAGLPVIAAQAASDLDSSRYLLTGVGLLAVALVLLLVYRSWTRALIPLVPIVMATGWSALVLWLTRVPLNPMSAALGALTIAIATEFSVILAARFRQERNAGRKLEDALSVAYSRTGAAVLASGATAIAGFAVLIASDVGMLRQFGLVTVVDLAVALLGVVIALPATLVLAEQGPTGLKPTYKVGFRPVGGRGRG
ncbi:MAG TPA: MMPL family transporter [Solirubrobacterales bacterium]|nr:MMPL family transporter [Solirubrobacterales bacterium]